MLKSALDTAETQCAMAKRLVASLGTGLLGDTSQLSLQTMLGAFNRVTCATEMVGVSWKNPKEKGTTGREGCPLLVLLAMGGYDEELLPVGAEDINIMRRMEVLGKVVWFSGELVCSASRPSCTALCGWHIIIHIIMCIKNSYLVVSNYSLHMT